MNLIELADWETGNEAIFTDIERSRPWSGTVFVARRTGNDADDIVAMTFGATIEEAMERAALCALAPQLVERERELSDQLAAKDAEIARLREALRAIEGLPRHSRSDAWDNMTMMQDRARTALQGIQG